MNKLLILPMFLSVYTHATAKEDHLDESPLSYNVSNPECRVRDFKNFLTGTRTAIVSADVTNTSNHAYACFLSRLEQGYPVCLNRQESGFTSTIEPGNTKKIVADCFYKNDHFINPLLVQ